MLRYRLDTGVGDSSTGTFEEGIVAKDARDRKGVAGGDIEESQTLLSGEDEHDFWFWWWWLLLV